LKLTIAKYYTPKGRLIQRDYKDKTKEKEGGIFPDVPVEVSAKEEVEVLMQYNNVVYTPGNKEPKADFSKKDPVLEKAVEVLKEGTDKIIAQKAQLAQAAQEKPEQPAEQQAVQKEPAK